VQFEPPVADASDKISLTWPAASAKHPLQEKAEALTTRAFFFVSDKFPDERAELAAPWMVTANCRHEFPEGPGYGADSYEVSHADRPQ
jgi:hypothetical protein